MGEFEDYYEQQQIKLYVLSPRSPKMNCYVERANETYRYEFWNVYEIPDTIKETRKLLRKFEYKYNCEKMHQSLNYLTPMEYYYKLKEILTILNVMKNLEPLSLKSYKLHPLNLWSVTVQANWRITFEFDESTNDVYIVDYLDYH